MKKFIFYLFNSFVLSLFLLVVWTHFIFDGTSYRFTAEELVLFKFFIFIFLSLFLLNIYCAYKETKK